MADLSTITPDQELDLSEFGLQDFEDDLLIVDAGIEESENGRRWFMVLEPVNEVDAKEHLPNGQLRDGGFLTRHDDREDVVRIGISVLKRVFQAALGKQQGAVAELKGEMIHARVTEDDNGFARVKGYRAVRG